MATELRRSLLDSRSTPAAPEVVRGFQWVTDRDPTPACPEDTAGAAVNAYLFDVYPLPSISAKL